MKIHLYAILRLLKWPCTGWAKALPIALLGTITAGVSAAGGAAEDRATDSGEANAPARAPYALSTLIKRVTFSDPLIDGVTSGDQWPATWADDGQLYTAWGDGTGFAFRGGWDDQWTTYLGVARVEGTPPNHRGHNVWGGFKPESIGPAYYRNRERNENLKPNSGFVCISGVFYLYAACQKAGAHGEWSLSRLHTSKDHGRTWIDHGVLFDEPKGRFGNVCVIQYGKDYAETPPFQKGYVYLYGLENKEPSRNQNLLLARCDQGRLAERDAYEFFSGTADRPSWSRDLDQAQSVFHADGGVSWWVWCVYDIPLKRYLLLTTHPPFGGRFKDHRGFGMFEAEHPWGSWKTIFYTHDVGTMIQGMTEGISFTIPSKWIQDEGKSAWMVFARRPSNPFYSFNLVKLRLELLTKTGQSEVNPPPKQGRHFPPPGESLEQQSHKSPAEVDMDDSFIAALKPHVVGRWTLWNRNNGVVFAGVGVESRPSSNGIPHLLERAIRSENSFMVSEKTTSVAPGKPDGRH